MESSDTDLKKLDDVVCSVRDKLFVAKANYEIYKTISEHAKKINKKKRYSHVWAVVQNASLDAIILNLCKVFDRSKSCGYEQNSLENVVEIIANGKLIPNDDSPIKALLASNKIESTDQGVADGTAISALFEAFRKQEGFALRKLRTARDKHVAHSQYQFPVVQTASLNDIEKIIRFGWEFCRVALNAYCHVWSEPYEKVAKTDQYLDEILLVLLNTEMLTPAELAKIRIDISSEL